MTDPRREKEIFENALDLASVEERQRFVRQACGGDTDLLARVQGLLQALDQAEGFLAENLAAQGQETAPVEETTVPTGEREERHPLGPEDVGHRVGCYKLLQKIGEGGCGTVYMAEQLEPVRRRVALKIVKLGMDTRQVITRFEAERQALAVMDHPNIARILDAGATASGRPYFVMELVRGVRITQFCDERQLPLRERLGLFVQVCQAVQHAHQKGIIHRDIKPSNILVTLNDGVPMPKVIDFGIAKATQGNLTDKTLFTMFEHFIGTPAYMSPEQAEVRGVDIDTRSDIYSLGVVLYELLTGRTPFDSRALLQRGIEELILTLRQVEPPRPSTRVSTLAPADLQTVAQSQRCEVPRLVPALRGDLDWIVMKCLEKDRARRYDTANGLAADLQRHLVHEPVVARPPSTAYRVQKAWQRNRVAFTAGTLVASTLLVGAGVSTWQAIRATRARQAEAQQRFAAQYAENRARAEQREAERERQRAEASEARTSDLLYAANMNLAQAAFKENNFERTRQLLEVTSANPKRGFEWYYWQSQMHREARILRGHVGPVHSVGFAPDGRRLVTGGQDGWVIVWDASTGEERLRFHRDRGSEGIGLVAFSPDGERVLSSSGWDDRGLRIHHATTGAELLALSRVKGGSFSPDGRRIATIRGERVILWDSVTGQEVFSLKASSPFSDPFGQTVTFSPDGKSVLVPSMETVAGQHVGTEGLWDAATGEKKLTIREWTQVHAFSPDGRRVATMSKWGGNPPMIWDLANPDKPLGSLVGMLGQRASIKPSPDGGQWLTGGQNRTAQLWDATTFKELRTFRGHTGGIREVAFSADGQWIATASEDGTTRMWAVDAPDGPLVLRDPGLKEPQDAAVSPDGRWVASAHNTNAVIWDAATGRLVHKLRVYTRNPDRRREWAEDAVNTVSFSPDSQRVVAAGNNYVAIVFEVKTGQQLVTLDHSSADVSERSVRSATFSPDGRQIVTASADISRSGDFAKPLRIWDAATGQFLAAITENVHTIPDVWDAIFSPDGRRMIATGQTAAGVWDVESGKHLFPLPGGGSGCCRKRPLAVSPDGRFLATALGDSAVQLWDAATGEALISLRGHKDAVTSASFSADAQRLVTASDDRTAKVWDIHRGRELLTLEGHDGAVRSAVFFPSGQRILTCGYDGTSRIWDAATPPQLAAWQQEEQAGEKLVAARKADLEKRDQARQKVRDRQDAAIAKARAEGAALRGDPVRQASDPGAIKQWLVLAPIRAEGRDSETRLEEDQLPDEAQLRPHPDETVIVVGNYDGPVERVWTAVRQDDYRLDLKKIVADPVNHNVGYLVTYIVSETNRTGLLMNVGSDYHAKIYLNGRPVHERRNPTSFAPDRDQVKGVALQAELNVLVFKIVQSGPAWGGSVWITEADGRPVPGLRVTLDPDGNR